MVFEKIIILNVSGFRIIGIMTVLAPQWSMCYFRKVKSEIML